MRPTNLSNVIHDNVWELTCREQTLSNFLDGATDMLTQILCWLSKLALLVCDVRMQQNNRQADLLDHDTKRFCEIGIRREYPRHLVAAQEAIPY